MINFGVKEVKTVLPLLKQKEYSDNTPKCPFYVNTVYKPYLWVIYYQKGRGFTWKLVKFVWVVKFVSRVKSHWKCTSWSPPLPVLQRSFGPEVPHTFESSLLDSFYLVLLTGTFLLLFYVTYGTLVVTTTPFTVTGTKHIRKYHEKVHSGRKKWEWD